MYYIIKLTAYCSKLSQLPIYLYYRFLAICSRARNDAPKAMHYESKAWMQKSESILSDLICPPPMGVLISAIYAQYGNNQNEDSKLNKLRDEAKNDKAAFDRISKGLRSLDAAFVIDTMLELGDISEAAHSALQLSNHPVYLKTNGAAKILDVKPVDTTKLKRQR